MCDLCGDYYMNQSMVLMELLERNMDIIIEKSLENRKHRCTRGTNEMK